MWKEELKSKNKRRKKFENITVEGKFGNEQ